MNFVSNARFSFELKEFKDKSIDFSHLCCNELSDSEKKLINETLQAELLISEDIKIEDDIFFHVSNTPVHNSEISSIAALVDYFEGTNTQQLPLKLKPLHETLLNEIIRKSKYAFEVSSFDELVNCRSFTPKEVQSILTHALKARNFDLNKLSEQILNRLNIEKASIKTIQQFNRNSNQYIIDKLNIVNEAAKKIEKAIQIVIATFDDDDFDQELLPCVEMIYKRFSERYVNKYDFDEFYIRTLISFQIYGDNEI